MDDMISISRRGEFTETISAIEQMNNCNMKKLNLVPSILFYHVGHLNNEFTFFVLLAGFKSMFLYIITRSERQNLKPLPTHWHICCYTHIFPAKRGSARTAIYVCYCMKSRQEYPLFCSATAYIYPITTQRGIS